MSTYRYIKTTEAPGVLRMVLARPPLNILNIEMIEEINRVLEGIRLKPEIKALVIAAEGRAFSAGGSGKPERV